MNFEWLLFDFDNTLTDFNAASKLALKDTFKFCDIEFTEDNYQTYKKINKNVWSKFEEGKIDAVQLRKERFDLFLKSINKKGIDPLQMNLNYMENVVNHTTLYEGVLSFLKSLKKSFKIGIVTNGLKEAQRPRLKKIRIYDLFDTIVVSDEIGSAKPDRAYFEFVHKEINKPPKEKVLVIGDNINSDIKGAHEYGYKSCWISSKQSEEIIYDYRVEHVKALEHILYPYKRISCDIYDELEQAATLRKAISFSFMNSKGEQQNVQSKIKTLQTKNKVEYLILEDNRKIRLDKLQDLKF